MLVSKKDGSRMLLIEGIIFSFFSLCDFFSLQDLGLSLSLSLSLVCIWGDLHQILCAISFLCWILTERFTV